MHQFLLGAIFIALLLPACRTRRKPETVWQQAEGFARNGALPSTRMRSVVYPYSVVAGGLETRGDALEVMGRDPLVRKHYSEVNVQRLEVSRLPNDTLAYVSFRKNGQIYWTSNKVNLLKGEPVLSDGTNCIRARCGNRISWEPRGPVLQKRAEEPTPAQLNTAEIHGQSLDDMPLPTIILASQPAAWTAPDALTNARAVAVPVSGSAPLLAGGSGGGGQSPAGAMNGQNAGPLLGLIPTAGQSPTPAQASPAALIDVSPLHSVLITVWPVSETVATALMATVTSTPAVPVYGVASETVTTSTHWLPTRLTGPTHPSVPNTPKTTPPPGTPGTPNEDPPPLPPTPPVHLDTPGIPPEGPPSPVPEPASVLLLASGGVLLAVRRHQNRGVGLRDQGGAGAR